MTAAPDYAKITRMEKELGMFVPPVEGPCHWKYEEDGEMYTMYNRTCHHSLKGLT